jgi:hypothetical protein
MIRKYQNELIVAVALVFLLAGFLYERGMERKLQASLTRNRSAALQITETQILQKVWSTKGIKQKLSVLHRQLPAAKIKTFRQDKQKLSAEFWRLNGKELNALATYIASLPVQIQEMTISRDGKHYNLRCVCSW